MKKIKLATARKLRKQLTKEEHKVWQAIRNRRLMNLKFRRQRVIRGYIVDFYCCELSLAIEIDGAIHMERVEYDEARQRLLAAMGVRFIRFTNEEVNTNIHGVIKRIAETAVKLSNNACFVKSTWPTLHR